MTLETFFEKFDQLADSSNAVARMRELILQLAAHGKLVEQSRDDEPASALVVRIEKYVAELRSRKEFRGLPVEPLDREELPGIPSTWEWVRLGNVVDYGSSDKAESADIPDDAWLLDLEDIQKDTSRLLQRKSFRDSPSKSTKTVFAVGDVLYGKLRPYLNKVLVADAPGYCTTEIIPIRAFGFIDPVYLCHALKRPEFIAYANSKSYGMNLPRLSTEDARNAPFPLPPLAEQKRIVAKVDELMALCDRLEAQQQERETRHAALACASLARFADAPTPANLILLFHPAYTILPSDLRKSILTLAVQGKLVPQDPNDEPAEDWLRTIDKAKPNEGGEIGEPPFSLPAGWVWLRVASVFEVAGGIQKTPHRTPRNNAFPYLGVGNVYRGRLDLTNVKEFELEPGELDRRRLEAGDLLVIEGNGSFNEIGRCAKWNGEIENCVHQNHVIRCRPADARISDFVLLFLNSPNGMEIMQRLAITSSGLYSLSVGKIRRIEIPVPPLAEQRRIVAKVDQLMTLVNALETQLTTAHTTAENLMEAVVAELTNRG